MNSNLWITDYDFGVFIRKSHVRILKMSVLYNLYNDNIYDLY